MSNYFFTIKPCRFEYNNTTGHMGVNGDDAVELFYDATGAFGGVLEVVVDLYGYIDVDGSGQTWEYMDGWSYRNDGEGPNSVFTEAEWNIAGANVLDGETTNGTATTPIPVGTYTTGGTPTEPQISNVTHTPASPASTDAVNVYATVTDDGTITEVNLKWGIVSGNYTQTIAMPIAAGDVYSTTTTIDAQVAGTTVYYVVWAQDGTYSTTSTEQSYTVVDMPTQTLFISEYIEGSGNNKAIEIYNPTDAAVDLQDYRIAYANNGGDWSVWHTYSETTTIEPGEVWVLSNNAADAAILAQADEVFSYPSIVHYNGDDAIALEITTDGGNSWNIIDIIGNPLNDPGNGWDVAGTTGATADHTLVRKFPDIETGNNDWTSSAGTDPSDSEWQVNDQNDFSFIGWHGGEPTDPTIVITAPVDGSTLYTSTVTVVCDVQNFDVQPVGTGDGYIISNLNGNETDMDFTTFDYGGVPVGTYTLTVTLVDNTGTPLIPNISNTITFFVDELATVSIYDIQYTDVAGDGTYPSLYADQVVTTTGIVTAIETVNEGAIVINYYLQDGDGAWNGVYVYDNNFVPAVGDEVTITAEVIEYNGLTEISNVTEFTVNSSANTLPTPTTLTTLAANDEQYEGVLIQVLGATCTNIDAGFGMWAIDDGSGELLVDDDIQVYTPTATFDYDVTGLGHYSFDNYKIIPRNMDDIVEYVNTDPMLTITSPANAAIITVDNVDITFEVENFVVDIPSGSGDGHIHYTVNGTDMLMYYTTDPISLTGLTDGEYTVEMWLVDNTHTALDPAVEASVTFTIDAVDKVNELNSNINIYPNPVVSTLNIDTENINTISIFNTLGQLETEINVSSNNTQIDVSAWNSGIYFVKLSNNETTITKTVVKQ